MPFLVPGLNRECIGGVRRLTKPEERHLDPCPTEREVSMRLRTAFIIAGSMLAIILFTALSFQQSLTVPSDPVVYAQPRTDYLPPIPAPPVVPTTTTTTVPPTTTTTTAPQVATGSEGVPAAWYATAICEEGGRNDPYAGYFGILEWNGFDGYPTAGSAPLSVQLDWETAHGISPPDAPGQCHSY